MFDMYFMYFTLVQHKCVQKSRGFDDKIGDFGLKLVKYTQCKRIQEEFTRILAYIKN